MARMPTPRKLAVDDLPVEKVPTSSLRQDPDNARAHGDRNLAAIRASLMEFGQRKPLVTDATGTVVVAGNGTLSVAVELGWPEVWITRFPGSTAQARAYALADNRTAELATWDTRLLAASLEQVRTDELLHSVAWEDHEIQDLLAAASNPVVDVPSAGPTEFPAYDDETIETEHTCPKCGYEWSGGS